MKSFAEPFGEGPGNRGFCITSARGRPATSNCSATGELSTPFGRAVCAGRALVAEFQRRRQGNTLLVTFKQGELEIALQGDTTPADLDASKWDAALAALLYLDANEALPICSAARRCSGRPCASNSTSRTTASVQRTGLPGTRSPLQDKIIQVHVMAEYISSQRLKIQAAMGFIVDYFSLDRAEFVRRYFARPGRA